MSNYGVEVRVFEASQARSRAVVRRGAAVVAALAAGALALSGCATAPDASESALQAERFPGVYAQTIEWGACGEDFGLGDALSTALDERGAPIESIRCAMIEAPLDWNAPTSHETIELAAVHIPSSGTGEPIGTLLSNPGGPGESGLSLALQLTTTPGFDDVHAQYDILGFDPRGIGRSTPVECDAVSTLKEVNLATCAAEHPIALSMGTSQVARDMDLLRALMHDDRMHYVGYSYGTMLGGTYSTLFPERVGRMVLDSAAPGNWASPIGNFNQSLAIADQLDALLDDCGTRYEVSSCPLDSQTLTETTAALDAAPLIASDGTEVTGDALVNSLISALYQRQVGRELSLELAAAVVSGDQSAIDALAAEMSGGGSAVTLDGTIVKCHSFPADPDLVGLLERIDETGIPPILGGPDVTDDSLRDLVSMACDALPNSGDDITDTFSGSPDAPILVIGITGDHATPYAGAERLVSELGNARLLTLEGTGHGASFMNRSTCADDVATDYLLSGELPPKGTVCTDD